LSVGVDSLTGMAERWSGERVLALAPDSGSATAGRRLASAERWTAAGHRVDPGALWGLSQGSAAKPYQTVVDLTGPAYKCSCPSRKFPCKHALGLMLCWAAGQVAESSEVPPFAVEWLSKRAASAKPAGQPGESGQSARSGPADPVAAAKRAADRVARVSAGLEELDQWLCDQIRAGLAGLDDAAGSGRRGRAGHGQQQFEAIAARMVDAQAPGVAARLRRLPGVLASGEGWHGRLLEHYAQLRLLIGAHRRLAVLPAGLAAAVRTQVGYPMAGADVLATGAVRDTWSVLGLRDQEEERLTSRRVWLQGEATGRPALILSYVPTGFGASGATLDQSLVPGTSLDADLHFYPGGVRALVGARYGEPGRLPSLRRASVAEALAGYAAALAADPWTVSWPFLLAGVVPVRDGERWLLREDGGAALPLAEAAGSAALWTLIACSGGEPVTVLAEWSTAGLIPLSVIRRSELVAL
jgi:hypothetical protein